MEKISIITVTYNSAQTLEQTIQTVLAQTYPNVEYIIVDGKSTDNTLAVIEKYRDRISTFVSEKDDGLYHALNKGIALATGDIIGILHADDFYIDNTVLTKVAETFAAKKADAVYADLYYVDKDNTDKIIRTWKSGEYKASNFLWGWMPPHPTFFVKKEFYTKHGAFNTNLRTAADYEIMLRLLYRHNIKAAYLPKFIIKMRVGGQSNATVKNRVKANNEDRMAWKLNDLKPYFFTLTLKPLRKITQFLK
ncbi:MAG TPA: glycosyltransferase family 2 protein [Bacteroidia bacterium]|jgi:glycosyltransferase involved in cell wall biosynthesis|nr:glycosyltransferase family 2 protein [Bacteroidia bacterium]